MRQVCQVGLLIAVLLVGCSKSKPEPKKATTPPDDSSKEKVGKVDNSKPKDGSTPKVDDEKTKRAAKVKDLVGRARAAMKNKDYLEAIKLFTEAQKLAPDNAEVKAGLQLARAEELDEDKRRNKFDLAIRLGKKALDDKKYDEAIVQATAALKLYPENAKAKDLLDKARRSKPIDPKVKLEQDYQAAMKAGRTARDKKDHKQAISDFKAALALKPKDKAATAALDDAIQLQKAEEARVVEGKKKEAAYLGWMKKGSDAVKLRKWEEAYTAFDEALKIKNGDLPAIKGKREADEKRKLAKLPPKERKIEEDYLFAMSSARDAITKKSWKGAVFSFKEALRLKPKDKAATDGLAAAEKALKAEEEAAYAGWMKKGNDALKAMKWAEAYKAFDEALKIKNGDLPAIKGKRAAETELKKPKIDPKVKKLEEDYQAAMKSAQTAVTKKDYKGAIKEFKTALTLKPKDKAAADGLASAEKDLKAEEDRLREVEAKKKEAAYLGWMKKGNDALKMRKWEEAYKAFDEALKIKNGDLAAIKGKREADEKRKLAKLTPEQRKIEENYQLAMSAARDAVMKKSWKGAVFSFKEALRLKPKDKAATDGLAAAEKALKAEEDKKPNPVSDPAQFDKLLAAAQTLEKQRKYADGVKAYQNALKAVVSDVKKNPAANMQMFKAWMGVGRCEHAAKRYTEAVKAYEEALKCVPNQPDAKAALTRAKAGKP